MKILTPPPFFAKNGGGVRYQVSFSPGLIQYDFKSTCHWADYLDDHKSQNEGVESFELHNRKGFLSDIVTISDKNPLWLCNSNHYTPLICDFWSSISSDQWQKVCWFKMILLWSQNWFHDLVIDLALRDPKNPISWSFFYISAPPPLRGGHMK